MLSAERHFPSWQEEGASAATFPVLAQELEMKKKI